MEEITLEQQLEIETWNRIPINELDINNLKNAYSVASHLIAAGRDINASFEAGNKWLPNLERKLEKSVSIAQYFSALDDLEEQLRNDRTPKHLIQLELKEKVRADLIELLKEKFRVYNQMRALMKKKPLVAI